MMDFKTGQRIRHLKRSLGAGTKADRPTVTASAKKSFLFNPFIAGVVHFSLHSRAWLALSLGMGILSATIGHLPAYAEGSRDLVDSGGDRAFIEFSNNASSTNAGIQRRTIIKVYVNEGETINLGSNVIGTGTASLQYRKPGSSTTFTCDTSTSPVGRITSLAQEAAGPLPNTGGYTPCTITVGTGEAGIWEIDFVSPTASNSPSTNNPSATAANVPWTTPVASNPFVAAWDVTVRNAGGVEQPGRAYANYLALNMGDNGRSFSASLPILTVDGYQYLFDGNGIDPFGVILFANNKGFKSNNISTGVRVGDPLYRSIQLVESNPGALNSSITFQPPGDPDNAGTRDYTHKIFFNTPDSSMPVSAPTPTQGTTWLYTDPVQPPAPSNLTFTGIEGTSGQSGTNPLGGNFKFESPANSPFSLILDIDDNGTYGDNNDRVLLGTATIGENTVFWDGKDGNGANVPPSELGYNATVNLYAGEIHLPVIDPENNPNGIIIRRLRDFAGNPSATPNSYLVHYDDRYNWTGSGSYDFSLCASGANAGITPRPTTSPSTSPICYGTPPDPRSALLGTDSSSGAHRWSTDFGNIRGMDSWAYYPSALVNIPGRIKVKQADLSVTKTDGLTTISAGASTTYTIVVSNAGGSDSGLATFQDTIPAIISNVSWSCTASSDGYSSCGATTSGTGNTISVNDVLIKNGGTLTYTVTGIVDPTATVGTVITNRATILRSLDVTDPNDPTRIGAGNNTATDTTTIVEPADYGDAPDTTSGTVTGDYQTTLANNGPRHTILTDLRMGARVDADNGLLQNATADNDDTTGGIPDDEDGVTLPILLATDTTYTAMVNVTTPGATAGYLVGWMDFNQNGQFETSEGVIYDADTGTAGIQAIAVGTSAANVSLSWTGITGLTTGDVLYARFRFTDSVLTTANGSQSTGALGNGEVEDYAITIDAAVSTTPDLLLVKRITRLIPGDGGADVPYTAFVNDPATTDDTDLGWPGSNGSTTNSYTLGESSTKASPGDTIEYTIYFLNTGDGRASTVQICDALDEYLTYLPDTYASGTFPPFITPGAGIEISFNGLTSYLTGTNDGDQGTFVDAGNVSGCQIENTTPPPPLVPLANPNGTVKLDLINNISASTGSGAPLDSYGYLRFRVKVN